MVKCKDTVSISGAYQSAGLVAHTLMLARIAQDENDEMKVVALTTATILTAASAMEAVLSEAAYVLKPSLYKDIEFRKAGAPTKYKKFTGRLSHEVTEIWNARIAVAHAEPDNKRTRFVGVKLNAQGAEWAANCVVKLSNEIWGASMPKWFSKTIGVT